MAYKFSITFIASLMVSACLGMAQASARSIQVTDISGNGVAGAQVYLLDQQNNKPIAPQPIQTDADGFFQVPAIIAGPVSVTIEAADFITTSFLETATDTNQLQLHREDLRTFIEIQGEATGFGNLPKDGQVDFSLVYPALSRRDLLNFDMTSIISTEVDTIKVAMQKVDMPSNLTLPTQRESYIIPITLKKPNYRMFVRRPGTYQMMATHGQFPLQKVMSDLQGGKSIFDVINHFKFIQAGDQTVTVEGNTVGQNINVSEMPFLAESTIKAPVLTGQERMITASLASKDGLFFPTDVKSIASGGSQALKMPNASAGFLVSLLTLEKPALTNAKTVQQNAAQFFMQSLTKVFNVFTLAVNQVKQDNLTDGVAVSLALQRSRLSAAPDFMGLIDAPRIEGETLVLDRPVARKDIVQVATYLTLAEVEFIQHGKNRTEKRYRLWELFTPGWASEVRLPQNNLSLDPAKTYRWEVMYLGRSPEIRDDGGYFLDNVTHVSRNSRNL